MGKGDKKTRKGKIIIGSHGNVRPRISTRSTVPTKESKAVPAG